MRPFETKTPTRPRWLIAALALALAVSGGAARASDLDEIKETQKKILERLDAQDKTLKEILQKIQAPPAARAGMDPAKVYTIPLGASPIRGPKGAAVTLYEFSDYQCPFCAKAAPLVDELMAAYPKDLRFVHKQLPLVQIHKFAMGAAKAAFAAEKQGKGWEMHDELYKSSANLAPEEIQKLAVKLGLDMKKFDADMASPEVDKLVQDDMNVAKTVGVTSTPTLLINGRLVTNRTVEGMKAMVDEELKKTKAAGAK